MKGLYLYLVSFGNGEEDVFTPETNTINWVAISLTRLPEGPLLKIPILLWKVSTQSNVS